MPVAEEKYKGVFSLNGELIPNGEAAIAPQDLAVVQGQAVFETLALYQGQLFASDRHWKRLARGAELFGLRGPASQELESGIDTVMKANALNGVAKARARVTLTAGIAKSRFENSAEQSNLIIEVSEAPSYKGEASVITVPFPRNERGALTGIKSINFGENAIALRHAREAGADEAIFPNTKGEVCEGSWSNLFYHLDGEIVTPPLESGCLPGITREIILELAEELKIPIQQRSFPVADLLRVDAAILTSTLREIQPVRAINGRTLPKAKFEAWKTLSAAYQKYVKDSQRS